MATKSHNSYGNQAKIRQDRLRPAGWPVGSFDSYLEAQAAVDGLSDREFPVDKLTIVGVDLMEVERVTGRLTWGRVLGGGAASGAWIGLFFGLLFGILVPGRFLAALIPAVIIGAIFGLIFAAVPYAMSQGRRDFTSMTQIVAGRYDVLCEPSLARQARDAIAAMSLGHRGKAGTGAGAEAADTRASGPVDRTTDDVRGGAVADTPDAPADPASRRVRGTTADEEDVD